MPVLPLAAGVLSRGTRWPRVAGEIGLVALALAIDLVVWGGDRTLRDGRLLPMWAVPVALAAFDGLLFLRRRRPVPVYAALWLFSLAGIAIPRFQPFTALLVALHTVASTRDRRTAGVAVALCAVPFGIDTYNAAAASPHESFLPAFGTFAVFWLVVTLVAWGFGRRSAAARERAAADTARALREARRALARDLHGSVANKINSMTMMAASVRLADHAERETLERIGAVGDRAIDELHRLLGLLRPPEDAPAARGRRRGLADLDTLVAETEAASDVTVVTAVAGPPGELDESVDHLAYEVAAEALANTVKYGGPGAVVDLTLRWTGEGLLLAIRDTPRPGTPRRSRAGARSSGHGLSGLRESVALVGGTLEAGGGEDGFLVTTRLPAARPVGAPAAPVPQVS